MGCLQLQKCSDSVMHRSSDSHMLREPQADSVADMKASVKPLAMTSPAHGASRLQAELATTKTQLHKADTERAALRSQAEELSVELDWCVRDLFRLKQVETNSRCLDWLDGAEGLSTVRAHVHSARAEAQPTAGAGGAAFHVPAPWLRVVGST